MTSHVNNDTSLGGKRTFCPSKPRSESCPIFSPVTSICRLTDTSTQQNQLLCNKEQSGLSGKMYETNLKTENTIEMFCSEYWLQLLQVSEVIIDIFIYICTASVCWASAFFAVCSPKIVVIMATVLSSRQNCGCVALKALHGECALNRCHIDFGKVHRAKLHPSNGVSCSILCTQTQVQPYHRAGISTRLPRKQLNK